MAARKKHTEKKPVRWTIPDVAAAPPRLLEARTEVSEREAASRAYPSAAEMMARGPETRAWLDKALRAIIQPLAVASAVSIGLTGCVDVGQLIGEDPTAAPVFVGSSPYDDKSATLTPLGSPGGSLTPLGSPGGSPTFASTGGGVVMHPMPPDKPAAALAADAGVIPPCPLPPLGDPGALGGAPPAVTPPAHPPAVRGRIRPIHTRPPTPPPVIPAVDPPELDGDIAMVHPMPPPMPGGPSVVMPPGGSGE